MCSIRNSLLVICGCTGTGKSDLAVAIAKKFNGEVINADSMQIYRGLDVVTNKMTVEQMEGIPHHLIGFLEPIYSKFNVHEYRTKALEIIQKIWDGRKLPILVGGTGYYIEAIVFDNNLVQIDMKESKNTRHELMKNFPTSDLLYEELKRVDPESASILHKNNSFRVLRALEIFYLSGKKKSDLHKLQRTNAAPDSHYGATLRFPNTLLINLDSTKNVLMDALNKRVDKMMERGLLEELTAFFDQNNEKLDEKYGIMQSIGPKEFLPFLKLDELQRESEEGKKKLRECVEMLKIQNRQYAQIQRRWFYNRIIMRGDYREIPKSISLNVANDFRSQIVPFSIDLVNKFLNGENVDEIIDSNSPPIMESPPINELFTKTNYTDLAKKMFKCEICDKEIQGMHHFEIHLKGRKHRKTAASVKKKSMAINNLIQ